MRKQFFLAVVTLVLVGCATATPTQKGAVTGSAIGAGLGAIIGHQSGETAEGALLGAAVGGLGGALIGDAMATKFCPQCGRNYLAGDNYCLQHYPPVALQQKGAPAGNPEEQQAQAAFPKFCSECGRRYPVDATYCGVDRTELKTAQ